MGEFIDKAKGKIKEAAGKVTGNEKLEAEGKIDVAKGEVKGAAKDARKAAEEGAERIREGAEDLKEDLRRRSDEPVRSDQFRKDPLPD